MRWEKLSFEEDEDEDDKLREFGRRAGRDWILDRVTLLRRLLAFGWASGKFADRWNGRACGGFASCRNRGGLLAVRGTRAWKVEERLESRFTPPWRIRREGGGMVRQVVVGMNGLDWDELVWRTC